MTTSTTRAAALCALLATTCLASPAFAQSAGTIAPPPSHQAVDGNGVDVVLGTFNLAKTEVSIGPDFPNGLAYTRNWAGGGWRNSLVGTMSVDVNGIISVSLGGATETFTQSGSTYTPREGSGASLVLSGGGFTYTARDGTIVSFNGGYSDYGPYVANLGSATSIVSPNGVTLTLTYKTATRCAAYEPNGSGGQMCTDYIQTSRLQSVTNNLGYQLKLTYATNSITLSSDEWHRVTSVRAINNAVEYCSPTADSCALTGSWPTATFSKAASGANTVETATDATGQAWRYTLDSSRRMIGIKRPSATADNVTIGYGTSGRVSSVNNEGVPWTYSYTDAGTTRTTTVLGPLSAARTVTSNSSIARITSDQDALGRPTSYQYDAQMRLTRATAPEGNYVQYTYDGRGNVTQTLAHAKASSSLADITASAVYPASCANPVTCNQPASSTDARGFVTDYSYDPAHGGLLSVTLPAPTAGAGVVRPQTRISYAPAQAYYKNSAGTIVASGSNVTLPTGSSACQTLAACAGTADEVKTVIGHGPAGAANNLLPVTASSGSGDNVLTATSVSTYDAVGNLLTVDGPLPGTADTARLRYDNGRRVVGSVSPDPDGSGALKHRARRLTYNLDGQVTKSETGTVAGQSDVDWAGLSVLETSNVGYDAQARPVRATLEAGGAIHALSQTSYNALGRTDCVAQRMNPDVFATITTGACVPGMAGSFGPDRIVKTLYDAAGQVTQVRTALGAAAERNETTSLYTDNGLLASVTDAENNKTDYGYDGFDRIDRTFFPSATKGAGASNAADWEGYGYDAGGNMLQRQLRDGSVLIRTFDALGRETVKKSWKMGVGVYEQRNFAFDNLGRLKQASDGNGYQGNFGYDALGRNLTQSSTWYGTKTSAFDLAGRRTRLTWADGFYVDYDYLVTGEMRTIRENGAVSGVGVLATFGYDDRGRRISLTRGNGTVASYGYDAASRLASLGDDLAGTANDQSLTFSYTPAGQIAALTRANDVYAWSPAAGTTASTANGLNQIASVGGATPSYDAKGNMLSDGTRSYTYTTENGLASAPGSLFAYDPLGRLYYASATQTIIDYDGEEAIVELDSPTGRQVRRRYVHGPGTDEPLVWYEGAGTSDRRFLHADERGSVVAVSDGAGNAIGINRYDEYGVPAATNIGKYQYTGQMWVPEAGLYYYKARMYDPRLGRFLQTDPIGYGSGMNLYAYVGGDPVNARDPSGLDEGATTSVPIGSHIPTKDGYLCDSCSGFIADVVTRSRHKSGSGGLSKAGGSVAIGAAGASSTFVSPNDFGSQFSTDIVVTAQLRGFGSPGWSTSDFINHYFSGNGVAIDLNGVGLGRVFRESPSVQRATQNFVARLQLNVPAKLVVDNPTVVDVTDRIFAVGRSTFFMAGYCNQQFCFARFGINDRFGGTVVRCDVGLGRDTKIKIHLRRLPHKDTGNLESWTEEDTRRFTKTPDTCSKYGVAAES